MTSGSRTVREVKRVFIASPSDVTTERRLFPKILQTINALKAHPLGILLEPLGWEKTPIGPRRAQGIINEDIKQSDLFVMVLWKHWGTPPGKGSRYSSGVEEEFALARRLFKRHERPWILLYFRQVPEAMMKDPGKQLQQVLGFRKGVENEKSIFFSHYATPGQWEQSLMKDISGWLDGLRAVPRVESRGAAIPVDQRLSEPLEGKRKAHKRDKDSQLRLRKAATGLAKQAVAAARFARWTQAEELFAKSLDRYPELWVVNTFGVHLLERGFLERAEEKFRQLESLAKRRNNRGALSLAYGNLGTVYLNRGQLAAAERMHRKALVIDTKLKDHAQMANDYGNLGVIHRHRGDLKQAEIMQRKALALEEELGRAEGIADTYINLAVVFEERGKLDASEAMLKKALRLNEELDRKAATAITLGNLGGIYVRRGKLAKAEQAYRRALALNKRIGRKKGMAVQLGNLGIVYRRRGLIKEAGHFHRQALEIEQGLGRMEGVADQYHYLAETYAVLKDFGQAEHMAETALNLFKQIGAKQKATAARKRLVHFGRQKRKTARLREKATRVRLKASKAAR